MNKSSKILFGILTIGILAYFINDWQRTKIGLDREETSNGWYKYQNDKIEFEFPNKLRNCYECKVESGRFYTVLTDEEYIINFMSNRNQSNLIEPKKRFVFPVNEKERIIRDKIDSILVKKNVVPDNTFVNQNLTIKEIELNAEEEEMNFKMDILGVPINSVVKASELNNCGSASWNYWALSKDEVNLKKCLFGLENGRFYIQKEKEEVFFELQKIKNWSLISFR